jgi:hypothetical protein
LLGAANLIAFPKNTFLHQSRLELNKFVDFKMFLRFFTTLSTEEQFKTILGGV